MFDYSRDFNNLKSRDASALFGGIGDFGQLQERRFAGTALSNIARLRQADLLKDKGYYVAPQVQQQSGPSWGSTLFGGLARGLTSGIRGLGQEMAWNDYRYGSPSITPWRGELPSTTTDWAPPPPLPPVN
ncbi:MAG TPA: hypothetical protein DEP13_08130 [Gammaproteobacteria bacterium]|nr:MAG: hypothetical protein CBD74_06060 [Saprospirales bacterium TMED214]HCA36592.1 hypothetical protein [Gammaproteobacteria bacterium]